MDENQISRTLGQNRVKASFNPSESDMVEIIKNKTAELIDLVEEMRGPSSTGELHRLVSLAQTNFETACMYAVKANFTD